MYALGSPHVSGVPLCYFNQMIIFLKFNVQVMSQKISIMLS